jgi:hypothetical protein|tara:strand:- start:148 stop:297 length:150 start_codon:yes stop_codon:yes gene_type:complete
MKQLIYEIKHFGWRIGIGNFLILKGGKILKAKRIRVTYYKGEVDLKSNN